MDNPLAILKCFWRSRRPSLIRSMPAMRNNFWLRQGYDAMTFFGTIITATQEEAERINNKNNILKNHEMIHLRQAQSLHDSWLLFYLRYGWYSLMALPQCRYMKDGAYLLNPFELEAYRHQEEMDYLQKHEATEWRKWAQLKPAERREKFYPQYHKKTK